MAEIWENRIPYFFDNVLKTPAGSLPKGAQWVVAFHDLAGTIMPAINLALTYEKKNWQIQNAADIVTSEAFQTTNGCVFAQAIDLPGESLVVNPEGNIMSNALIRSYVGQGRNQFPVMRMTFLETNASFVDNFLRPWVIATGAFGLFARDTSDEKNYRTNLECYKLGSYSPEQPPIVLMKITFYDICCVEVSNEEYNYAPVAGQAIMREAQFVYNYYTVDTSAGGLFQDTSNPTLATAAQAQNQQVNLNLFTTPNQLSLDNKISQIPNQPSSLASAKKVAISIEQPTSASATTTIASKTQQQTQQVNKVAATTPVTGRLTKITPFEKPLQRHQQVRFGTKLQKPFTHQNSSTPNVFENITQQQEDGIKDRNNR